jgi:hypothetical protein
VIDLEKSEEEREGQGPQRVLQPGLVRVLRVAGDAEHLRAQLLELGVAAPELHQLRRTHEREVERVEDQDHVLAGVVGELDLGEVALTDYGRRSEVGGLLQKGEHHCLLAAASRSRCM